MFVHIHGDETNEFKEIKFRMYVKFSRFLKKFNVLLYLKNSKLTILLAYRHTISNDFDKMLKNINILMAKMEKPPCP